MWDFIKRWHPVILLLLGIYLAVPKPAPNPAEIDDEFLKEYDKNGDGSVDKTEFTGLDFAGRDKNNDDVLTVGSMFRWPLHDFRWNLGQDLKGGSSLRYELIQQDMADSEKALRDLFAPLADNADKLSPEARDKFETVVRGGELKVGAWSLRELTDEKDDFDLLITTNVFDEGRADAARTYYRNWQEARVRKDDKNLVGPTIETLNRRLNATGITELNISPLGENRVEVKLPKFSSVAETQRFKDLLTSTGKLEMRVLAAEDGAFKDLQVNDLPRDEGYKYRWLELTSEKATGSRLAKDLGGKKYVPVMVLDEYNITGKDLSDIQPSMDNQGQMAVSFSLKGQAVARFENLTGTHREGGEDPRLLAVIIDDKVYSAYTIKDKISGNVQLSGRFTAKERDDIINVLKSGSLNVKLKLEGEESVGPSEGAEAVSQGRLSLIVGAVLVFLIALFMYRGLGVLTVFNLVMVVVLVMGALSAGLGTLTMPGIAGIVLTIGMAIDSNILINERIREEYMRGIGTKGAVEEGFANALSAIVDSNITTLLTALILFKLGSGPIQGFALTLAIGIVATLYTALAAYRTMINGVLKYKPGVVFKMTYLKFAEKTNFNFTGYLVHGVIVSSILVIIGISVLFVRGSSVLGMEFRGGHTFRIQMKEALDREAVEAHFVDASGKLKFEELDKADVQPVYGLSGASDDGKAMRYDFRFPMRTEWEGRDQNDVNQELRKLLEQAFADTIATQGWNARTVDVREATLQARLRLKLKDPAKFREAHAEDFEKLWLMHERSWRGDPNAPATNKDRWFGDVVRGSPAAKVSGLFEGLSAGKDVQTYVLRVEGVTATDAAQLAGLATALEGAIKKYFWEASENVVQEGATVVETLPTKARLSVDLSFVEPVKVEDFKALAKDLPSASPVLGAITFTLDSQTRTTDKAAVSTAFTLSTSEITFSADPTNAASYDNVSGAISTAVTDWLKNAEPKGNELSNPFLLASAIGATVAGEMQWKAMLAILAALIVTVVYIRLRFAAVSWGIAAVIGLIHDCFLTVAAIGIADALGMDIKIDMTVVAALLTVIGYSLNNTIVEFDRTRENLKKDRLLTGGKTPLRQVINDAVNQMLSRTILTSGTTLVTTLSMLFLGGPLLKGFAFAMTMGVFLGTFSSVYIAGPIRILLARGETDLLDMTEEEMEREGLKDTPAETEASDEEPDFSDDAEDKADKPQEDKKPEATGDKPAEGTPGSEGDKK
ncbi:MAG: protein translocase subunit SecD [Planctomycetes bacterium]|nr:protein translocase subunit SecD [Planctomycetota bacterium]